MVKTEPTAVDPSKTLDDALLRVVSNFENVHDLSKQQSATIKSFASGTDLLHLGQIIFGRGLQFTNKHSMTLKGGACILNYSSAVLTNCPMYFGLLLFKAVYNLAYMVEHNYSLKGILWNNVGKNDVLQGNLTFAASLYQKCRDATENNNESFLPCAFGVVRVKLKLFWQNNSLLAQACAVMVALFVGLLTVLVFFSDGNGL